MYSILMKNFNWMLSILSILILSACDKSDEELSQVMDVSQYVDLLSKGKYTALELSSFTAAEISDS